MYIYASSIYFQEKLESQVSLGAELVLLVPITSIKQYSIVHKYKKNT